MSLEAIVWGWKQEVGNPLRKLILIHMCDAANSQHGNMCWHKIASIAKVCETSRSTVKTHLRALCDSGHLTLVEKGGLNGGTNKYRLNHGDQFVSIKGSGDNPKGSGADCQGGQELTGVGSGADHINSNLTVSLTNTSDSPESNPAKMNKSNHESVIAVYHEVLPELQSVLVSRWHGTARANNLASRWKEDERFRSRKFWTGFFETVRTNPHWMGDNDRGWKADLEWLVKRVNFDKVLSKGMNG